MPFGLGDIATVYASTAGHGQSPKMVKQKSSEVRVPITISLKSWARIGPSRPIDPSLVRFKLMIMKKEKGRVCPPDIRVFDFLSSVIDVPLEANETTARSSPPQCTHRK